MQKSALLPTRTAKSLVYSMVYLDRFAISIFENRGLDFERAKIQPPIFASGPSVSGPGILGGYEQYQIIL